MFVKILCFKGFHKPEKGGDVIRHSSRLGSTRRNVDFGIHWRPGVSAYSLDRELLPDGNKGVSIYIHTFLVVVFGRGLLPLFVLSRGAKQHMLCSVL